MLSWMLAVGLGSESLLRPYPESAQGESGLTLRRAA